MTLIEPEQCYRERMARREREVDAFLSRPIANPDAEWDATIAHALMQNRGQPPIRIMTLVNALTKQHRPILPGIKWDMQGVKRLILQRITALFRQKKATRHKRVFVRINEGYASELSARSTVVRNPSK